MRTYLTGISAAALVVATPAATATVVTSQELTIPSTAAGAQSQVAFDPFDGALGTLTSVVLSFEAGSTTDFNFLNNTGSERTWTVSRGGAATLSGYGLQASSTFAGGPTTYTLAARLSPSNPRTGSASYAGSYTGADSVFSALAAFVGSEKLTFTFAPSEAFGATGSGGSVTEGATVFTGKATLAYEYEPATAAVPEPATWAMMIGGFGLLGGALRRRTAATA